MAQDLEETIVNILDLERKCSKGGGIAALGNVVIRRGAALGAWRVQIGHTASLYREGETITAAAQAVAEGLHDRINNLVHVHQGKINALQEGLREGGNNDHRHQV